MQSYRAGERKPGKSREGNRRETQTYRPCAGECALASLRGWRPNAKGMSRHPGKWRTVQAATECFRGEGVINQCVQRYRVSNTGTGAKLQNMPSAQTAAGRIRREPKVRASTESLHSLQQERREAQTKSMHSLHRVYLSALTCCSCSPPCSNSSSEISSMAPSICTVAMGI